MNIYNPIVDYLLLPTLHKTFYIGKVVDNNDELKVGRLKINIPELTEDKSIWIKPLFKNFTPLPNINDYVVVIRFGYSIDNLFYLNYPIMMVKSFEKDIEKIMDQSSVINNNYDKFSYIGFIPNIYLQFYNNDKFMFNGCILKTLNHLFILSDKKDDNYMKLKGQNYLIQVIDDIMVIQVKSPNIVINGKENIIEINQDEFRVNSLKTSIGQIKELKTSDVIQLINEELSKRLSGQSSGGSGGSGGSSTGSSGGNIGEKYSESLFYGGLSRPYKEEPKTLVIGSSVTKEVNMELINLIKINDLSVTGNTLNINVNNISIQSTLYSINTINFTLNQEENIQVNQKEMIVNIENNLLFNQKNITQVSECYSISTNEYKLSQKQAYIDQLDLIINTKNNHTSTERYILNQSKNVNIETDNINIQSRTSVINTNLLLINNNGSDEYKVIRKSDIDNLINVINDLISTLVDEITQSISSIPNVNVNFSNTMNKLVQLNNIKQYLGSQQQFIK